MSARKWLCVFCSSLPLNGLRVFAYRWLCGYRIGRGSRIGFCAVIHAKSVEIGRAVTIAMFTRISDVAAVSLGDGVSIGTLNLFGGMEMLSLGERTHIGSHLTAIAPRWQPTRGSLITGQQCVITGRHHIDLAHDIRIGNRVTIGGVFSALWTHGLNKKKGGAIEICDDCYLGSGVQIGPNVKLPARTVVGMGAVVTRGPLQEGLTIVGVPAKPITGRVETSHRN